MDAVFTIFEDRNAFCPGSHRSKRKAKPLWWNLEYAEALYWRTELKKYLRDQSKKKSSLYGCRSGYMAKIWRTIRSEAGLELTIALMWILTIMRYDCLVFQFQSAGRS